MLKSITQPTILMVVLLIASTSMAKPVAWSIDKSHAHIMFEISHLGFSTTFGTFKEFDGTINLDTDAPENSTVNITIQVGSIDSAWNARDKHLLSPDFFDVSNHPTMNFTSTSIAQQNDDSAIVSGNFTMLGNTLPLDLHVNLANLGPHPMNGKQTAAFDATAIIERSKWGLSTYSPNIGEEVKVRISFEATKN